MVDQKLRYIVGKSEFEQHVLKPAHGVIVDFTASWCPPCKKLGALFEEKIKTSNGWTIIKMDVDEDENKQIATEHQVKGIPAVFLYYKGKKVDQFTGYNPQKLDEFIKRCVEEFNVFSGQGLTLGGNNLQVNINVDAGKNLVTVDTNLPSTTIQIRLSNGQKIQVDFNLTTSVGKIYEYVSSISPGSKFQLVGGGYPPTPFLDLQKTIEEADLMDASLTQKII